MKNFPTLEYFSASEFRCRCGRCGLDGSQFDPISAVYLDLLRGRFGRALNLISALRCEEWNRHEGGAENSFHLLRQGGTAVDIAVAGGVERFGLVHYAADLGFSIGVRRGMVHLDRRPGPQILFTYD